MVRDWYHRTRNTQYETTSPPARYQRYAGHDNNRDWIAQTQPETRSTVERLLNRWLPHVVIDLHQMHGTGPRYILPPTLIHLTRTWIQRSSRRPPSLAMRLQRRSPIKARQEWRLPCSSMPFHHHAPTLTTTAGSDCWARLPLRHYRSPVDVHPQLLTGLPGYEPHERSSNHPIPSARGRLGHRRCHRLSSIDSAGCAAARRLEPRALGFPAKRDRYSRSI